jgi:hypothetical protein
VTADRDDLIARLDAIEDSLSTTRGLTDMLRDDEEGVTVGWVTYETDESDPKYERP